LSLWKIVWRIFVPNWFWEEIFWGVFFFYVPNHYKTILNKINNEKTSLTFLHVVLVRLAGVRERGLSNIRLRWLQSFQQLINMQSGNQGNFRNPPVMRHLIAYSASVFTANHRMKANQYKT